MKIFEWSIILSLAFLNTAFADMSIRKLNDGSKANASHCQDPTLRNYMLALDDLSKLDKELKGEINTHFFSSMATDRFNFSNCLDDGENVKFIPEIKNEILRARVELTKDDNALIEKMKKEINLSRRMTGNDMEDLNVKLMNLINESRKDNREFRSKLELSEGKGGRLCIVATDYTGMIPKDNQGKPEKICTPYYQNEEKLAQIRQQHALNKDRHFSYRHLPNLDEKGSGDPRVLLELNKYLAENCKSADDKSGYLQMMGEGLVAKQINRAKESGVCSNVSDRKTRQGIRSQ